MEAARHQTPSAGLSAFLVEHDTCGSGFDISHPAGLGNGRLRITCRACGSSFEYAPGLASVKSETIEREIEIEPVAATVTPLPQSREPAAEPTAGSQPPKQGRGFPRERIVTAALLVFAIAAVVFAGIRLAQSGDGDSQPTPAAPPAPKPAVETPPAGATANPSLAPQPSSRPPGGDVLVRTPLYALVVPAAWVSRQGAGGSTVYSPTGVSPSVALAVFYERNPGIDRTAMAASTAGFLASGSGGATVGSPRFLRAGGDPAFELRAAGPSGTKTARGVLFGPYRFLAVASAAERASSSSRAALRRALSSFRAR